MLYLKADKVGVVVGFGVGVVVGFVVGVVVCFGIGVVVGPNHHQSRRPIRYNPLFH
jgi:hypothetical protein